MLIDHAHKQDGNFHNYLRESLRNDDPFTSAAIQGGATTRTNEFYSCKHSRRRSGLCNIHQVVSEECNSLEVTRPKIAVRARNNAIRDCIDTTWSTQLVKAIKKGESRYPKI